MFAAKTRGREETNLRPVYVVAIGMSDGRTPLAIRNCLSLEGVVLLKRREGGKTRLECGLTSRSAFGIGSIKLSWLISNPQNLQRALYMQSIHKIILSLSHSFNLPLVSFSTSNHHQISLA